jgi:hypothetical protein
MQFAPVPCKKIDTIGCFSGKKSGDFAVQDSLFETPLNAFLNAFWKKRESGRRTHILQITCFQAFKTKIPS